MILDFLKAPFGDRSPHYITRLGTCPVRFVGDEGSVETGDAGEIVAKPEVLQKLIPESGRALLQRLEMLEGPHNCINHHRQ